MNSSSEGHMEERQRLLQELEELKEANKAGDLKHQANEAKFASKIEELDRERERVAAEWDIQVQEYESETSKRQEKLEALERLLAETESGPNETGSIEDEEEEDRDDEEEEDLDDGEEEDLDDEAQENLAKALAVASAFDSIFKLGGGKDEFWNTVLSLVYYNKLDVPDDGAELEFLDMSTEELYEIVHGLELTLEEADIEHIKLISRVYHLIFLRTRSIGDIKDALAKAEDIVKATSTDTDSPDYQIHLRNLITMLMEKYECTKSEPDIDQAILRAEEMVRITPPGHPDRGRRISDLDKIKHRRLHEMFEGRKSFREVAESRASLDAKEKAGLSEIRHCMKDVAQAGDPKDLNIPLRRAERLIAEASQYNFPWKRYALLLLVTIFSKKFELTDSLDDLQEAIRATEDFVAVAPSDRPEKLHMSATLVELLCAKYRRTDSLDDLNKAIQSIENFTAAAPPDHQRKLGVLSNLGELLYAKFEKKSDPKDLSASIQAVKDFILAAPPDDPERSTMSSRLFGLLKLKYQRTGDFNDMNASILTATDFVATASSDHPQRPAVLLNLIELLITRFRNTGDPDDMDTAISLVEDDVASGSCGFSERIPILSAILDCLSENFMLANRLNDLNKMIQVTERFIEISGGSEPISMSNFTLVFRLATYLRVRFALVGDNNDLQASDQIHRRLERAELGEEHSSRQAIFHAAIAAQGLATSNNPEDQQIMIEKTKELTTRLDSMYGSSPASLFTLASSYALSHHTDCNLDDLELAIEKFREYLKAADPDEGTYRRALFQLCDLLHRRFALLGDFDALQEGIRAGKKGIAAIRFDDMDSPGHRGDLAHALFSRYKRIGAANDLEEAIKLWTEAVESRNSSPRSRIPVAKRASSELSSVEKWEEASYFAEVATSLLQSVSLRQLNQKEQRRILQDYAGLAGTAACTAMHAKKGVYHAIKLLEMGRGIIAGLRFGMRSDLGDLRKQHPETADEFERLRDVLDAPRTSSTRLGLITKDAVHPPQETNVADYLLQETNKLHESNVELDKIAEQIRRLPGFENFLLPPTANELLAVASSGPIVIINVDSRCDALIVNGKKETISSVALPGLNEDDIETYANLLHLIRSAPTSDAAPQMFGILEWLWDAAVGPILEKLEFAAPQDSDADLPRIWWIPTGKLSLLPLHAAGYHREGPSNRNTALDRVISSYATTIKAVRYARENEQQSTGTSLGLTSREVMLVSMDTTPKHSSLRFAKEEVNELDRILPSDVPRIKLERPSRKDVVDRLPNCSIFHFAGHGKVDPSDPSKSELLINDWEDNPLTVETLVGLNFRENPPLLAYLSACSTSDAQAESSQDEVIHLAAACQLAGFQHVVGSLWEVSDRYSVDAAKEIYETIGRNKIMDGGSISLGVHRAAKLLRDMTSGGGSSVRGEHESENLQESRIDADYKDRGPRNAKVLRADLDDHDEHMGGNPIVWAAYIHVGP
ncbi:hypothetical protein TWF694_001475 [Orbilia ellipsospora]|uniref:CHAT domain-containing protein n=1 Tax=Orbilia ellipsospora TaxID=2528407 RepID=A0AAV9XV34_9PEZI